jgi:hypothetical protein
MPRNLDSLRCAVRWTSLALLVALLAALPLQAQPPAAAPSAGGAYVLFLENGVTLANGTPGEHARAKALRTGPQEQLLWFQRGGKEYVLRDAATLKQIKALFEPQQKLAGEQAALGAKQAEQGKKQAEVGAKIAKVAAEQALLAGQGENSADLEARMQELEREQEKIAKPLKELGRQQEELGRKQKEAARDAETRLKALADQAIASGLAQEVK